MAVIQFSGLVSGIQGSLQGSTISRGRNGTVIYDKPLPKKAPTSAQLVRRSALSANAQFWRSATPTQRADWQTIAEAHPVPDRFGVPTILSGFAYYQKMTLLFFAGLPTEFLPPNLSEETVYQFQTTGISATFTANSEGFGITDLIGFAKVLNTSARYNSTNLYVSLPIADFERPYFGTWYLVNQGYVDINLPADTEIFFQASDIIMPKGWFTFNGAKHYFKGSIYIEDTGDISVDQIWEITAELEPPIDFPSLEFFISGSWGYYANFPLDPSGWPVLWSVIPPTPTFDQYYLNTQFAAPQPTQAPVDEGDWGDVIVEGITDFNQPTKMQSTLNAGFDNYANVYKAEYPEVETSPAGYYLPIRTRLITIDGDIQGPWNIGYGIVQIY